MRDFTKYKVWQDSIEFVTTIYKETSAFPDEERFGLTNQMRRCAASIPSNVSEGSSRSSQKDFKRFLEIAIGSSFELKTQLIISRNLLFLNKEKATELESKVNTISKQLNGLINKLKANS